MLLETKESSLNQGKLGKGVGSALPYSIVAKELYVVYILIINIFTTAVDSLVAAIYDYQIFTQQNLLKRWYD